MLSIRGTPAGMMTMSTPVRAFFFASSVAGSFPAKSPLAATKPSICCLLSVLLFRCSSSRTYCDRRDVGQVCRNTWSVDHIEQREFVDERRDLAKKRERLRQSVTSLISYWLSPTWPMPPEAPSTQALTIVMSGSVRGMDFLDNKVSHRTFQQAHCCSPVLQLVFEVSRACFEGVKKLSWYCTEETKSSLKLRSRSWTSLRMGGM